MPDKVNKICGDDPAIKFVARGDCRQIVVRDATWQWKTNGTDVTIYDPEMVRYDTHSWTVLDMTKLSWEYNNEKWPDEPIPITPKDISDYILEKIMGKQLLKYRSKRAA